VTVHGPRARRSELATPASSERMCAMTLRVVQWATRNIGTCAYTANRAVNAVAAVWAAAPGIRSTLDLPRIATTFEHEVGNP